MSPSRISGRSAPRLCRGRFRFPFSLLAFLLCAAACTPPAKPQTNDLPAEREIRGKEVQVFPVELQAGQFLRVVVQEEGIDVRVRLVDSDGKVATGVDGLLGGEATEDLAAVAGSTGRYTIEVIGPDKPKSGRYRLRMEAPRDPRPQDQVFAEAVRATWDGFVAQGAAEEQIRSLEKALSLWQQLGNTGKSAEVLFALANAKFSLGAYDQALASFQKSAELWSRQPGRKAKVFVVRSLTYAGRCLTYSERRKEARDSHEQALALARGLGEAGYQAENLDLLGRLAVEEGEVQKGIDWHRQALELARKAGDRRTESHVLNNLAIGYEQLGEMQEALGFFEQALKLARDTSNRVTEAAFLNNLGDTYRYLGNWEKAFENYRLAVEIGSSSGNLVLSGKASINLAGAYRHRGQLAEARDSLNRALALGRQLESRELQVFALDQLAFLLLPLKEPAQAVANAREAVGLEGSLEEQALSRYALGSALQDLGDIPSARTELSKALDLASRRGDRAREAELNLVLARMDREDGDLASALTRVQSAIEIIEARRGRVVDLDLRTSFLASKQDYYELKVDTLMSLQAKQPAESFAADALRASEQARARGLLEILNEAKADIHEGVDHALIEAEREARDEVNARDSHRRSLLAQENPDHERLAEAEKKLEEALDRYRQVQVDLRQGSPRYAALTQPQTLNVGEIQRQVLDGEALLLEYTLGAKRSFLWAVTADSFASFELPERERIEKTALLFYKLLTARNSYPAGESLSARAKRIAAADSEASRAALDLSKLILQPVQSILGSRPLLIVADGALQYIPFTALPIPVTGAPLATRHIVVNLPSASVLAVLRQELRDRPQASRMLAIFADPVFQKDDDRFSHGLARPDPITRVQAPAAPRGGTQDESREEGIDASTFRRLTSSGKEAEAIAALLPPGEVLKAVGFEASLAAVTNRGLEDYRNVHFATHGVLDGIHPEVSGLVLSRYNERGERESGDGVLHLNDIYNLRLGADLVVLSACETALGKEIRGEGLIGLTRGFMYSGAARVLASLWSVQDRPTAELMVSFYRGMLRDGFSPAAALREAQLEMASKPGRKSPYFWAGFSLQGEWR